MTDDDINTKELSVDQIKEVQYLVNRLRHDNKQSKKITSKFYEKKTLRFDRVRSTPNQSYYFTIWEFKKEQIQKMISDAYQDYLEKHYPGLTNDRAAFEFCEVYLEDKEQSK